MRCVFHVHHDFADFANSWTSIEHITHKQLNQPRQKKNKRAQLCILQCTSTIAGMKKSPQLKDLSVECAHGPSVLQKHIERPLKLHQTLDSTHYIFRASLIWRNISCGEELKVQITCLGQATAHRCTKSPMAFRAPSGLFDLLRWPLPTRAQSVPRTPRLSPRPTICWEPHGAAIHWGESRENFGHRTWYDRKY